MTITAAERGGVMRMTRQRRQVRDFVSRRVEQDRPPTLGEIVRCCGLGDRASAKRILRALRDQGMIPPDAWTRGVPGRPCEKLVA